MSDSYMFLRPSRLPLALADFGPDYASDMPTGPFVARETLERDIASCFPHVRWERSWASVTTEAGDAELFLFEHEGLYWSLKCHISNYAPVVQSICDRMGWVAIDPDQRLFQPHRPPIDISGRE